MNTYTILKFFLSFIIPIYLGGCDFEKINSKNHNNHAPEFKQESYDFTVTENTNIIGRIDATDADDSKIEYSVTPNLFVIDINSGDLSFQIAPTINNHKVFNPIVTAFDGEFLTDITVTVTVITDTDGDGVGDNADSDDDNDGVSDNDDAFPKNASESTDTDGDGVGDNADSDDDNDGVSDDYDALPLDSSASIIINPSDVIANYVTYNDIINFDPEITAVIVNSNSVMFVSNIHLTYQTHNETIFLEEIYVLADTHDKTLSSEEFQELYNNTFVPTYFNQVGKMETSNHIEIKIFESDTEPREFIYYKNTNDELIYFEIDKNEDVSRTVELDFKFPNLNLKTKKVSVKETQGQHTCNNPIGNPIVNGYNLVTNTDKYETYKFQLRHTNEEPVIYNNNVLYYITLDGDVGYFCNSEPTNQN